MKLDCVFCAKIADGSAESVGLLHDRVYHFKPLDPVIPGHRLFIPKQHVSFCEDLPFVTGLVFAGASRWVGDKTEDYNLIVNNGPDAGKTVDHLHVHYIPRRPNDGLIMSWTAQQGALKNEKP